MDKTNEIIYFAAMVIWIINRQEEWNPIELEGEMKIGRGEEGLHVSSEMRAWDATLFPWMDRQGRRRYILFSTLGDGKIKVNGYPMSGLKVLDDKDEVSLGPAPRVFYYSEESPPRKIKFEEASEKPLFCVRCKDRIEAGEEIVVCPKCRLYYHETEGRGCWMYDAACAGCRRPTGIDYTWRPEPIRIRKRGYAQ